MIQHKGRRTIIVTGASRGLGREIALRFGRARDRVVVNYRTKRDDAESVAKEIVSSGGEAIIFQTDVGDSRAVVRMIDETLKQWGSIDVLVNNAGIALDGLILRMSETDWDEVIRTNLSGPFYCLREAGGVMAREGRGHIISIASITGVQGREGQANYSASKAGLIGLTKACAWELGQFNVQVNAVLPGYLPTDLGGMISEGFLEHVKRNNVLGRISDQAEVADFVYHLSCLSNVSGQLFNLDSRIL